MSVNLNTRPVGEVTVIDVSGRLTLGEGSGAMGKEVHNLIEGGRTKLLLNLAGVSYIDSSGIGELVAGLRSAAKAGGVLKLLGLSKGAKELLRVTKLSSIFEVHEDEASAIQSFT
jgi:anti-sigma B factor antagonist